MKLVVTCPALYPTRERIHFLDDSARRFGIELRPHGIGCQFVDWRTMLMEHTLPAFRQYASEGATHVLYVDGNDSLFLSGLDEIVAKYYHFGAPHCLMSADEGQAFLNAGGYLAELDWMIPTWEFLASVHAPYDGDYQNWLIKSWSMCQSIELDRNYDVFRPIDDPVDKLNIQNGRIRGEHKNCPSVLHFRGGYSDPVTGRDERMRPVVEELWGDDTR